MRCNAIMLSPTLRFGKTDTYQCVGERAAVNMQTLLTQHGLHRYVVIGSDEHFAHLTLKPEATSKLGEIQRITTGLAFRLYNAAGQFLEEWPV